MKACRQCGKDLNPFQKKFCSVTCKSESQKKRIRLKCHGCGKDFSLLPYLKRKSNYCSVKCYLSSNNRKVERSCRVCGKSFLIKLYLVKQGFGIYCSRKCQHKTYPKRLEINCRNCGKVLLIPPSKSKLVRYCSKKCHDDAMRDYVERICRNCQQKFQLPRWELNKGKGSFCSRDCFIQFKGETTIEKKMRLALEAAKIEFKQEVKIGVYRADFLLKKSKTIIECDGDYWHQIPGAIERDKRKDNYLSQRHYHVVRIPEKNIRAFSIKQLMGVFGK